MGVLGCVIRIAVLMGWRVWIQKGIPCRGRAWSWVSREGRVPKGVGLESILVGVILKDNGNRGLHHVGRAGEGRRTWIRLLGLLVIQGIKLKNVIYKFVEK